MRSMYDHMVEYSGVAINFDENQTWLAENLIRRVKCEIIWLLCIKYLNVKN